MTASRPWLWRFLILALLGTGIACASKDSPPPARMEMRSAPPAPDAVWVQGRWVWQGRRTGYVWVPGHWRASSSR
jgi:hypothetical protein